MKMPWGSHKGEELEDLDDCYLLWVAENAHSAVLAKEAEAQLSMRQGRGVVRLGDGYRQRTDD